MKRRHAIGSMATGLLCAAAGLLPVAAQAQAASWKPSQPVEFIAPANPGGGWDTLVRTTARVLQEAGLADQNFAPINTPGGGGAVAWAQIAADARNPHKLFATSPPIILVPLSGRSKFNHSHFTPIARLITDYSIVLVRTESEHKSVSDLLEAIKKNPKLAVGGGSAPGSMDHVAMAAGVSAAGMKPSAVNYVAFSGGGEAMVSLLGGHVAAVITGAGEAQAQLAGGKVRALAVSSPARLASMPDVPTFKEQGIDYTFDIWRGVMGPPNMPEAAVAYYQDLFARMLKTEQWAKARDQLGWLDAYQDGPTFRAFLDEQHTQFRSILTDLGLIK